VLCLSQGTENPSFLPKLSKADHRTGISCYQWVKPVPDASNRKCKPPRGYLLVASPGDRRRRMERVRTRFDRLSI